MTLARSSGGSRKEFGRACGGGGTQSATRLPVQTRTQEVLCHNGFLSARFTLLGVILFCGGAGIQGSRSDS